jgi:flagellar hook protein FlgE
VIDGNTIEVDMVDGSATDSLDALEAAIDGVDGLGATRVDGTITITADDNGENSFEVSSASSWLPGVEGSSVDIMDQEDEDWPVVTTIAAGELNWKNGARQGDELDYQMSITQFSTESRVVTQQSDGYSSGYLTDISVDMEGIITGTYSNGESRSLARLALGKFANDNGLEKLGNNLYGPTRSSGPADIGTPGAGFGRIFSNSLEQSTVDIAEEFTRMITTQRAFQANSKTITTTDEMLSEVINMKR